MADRYFGTANYQGPGKYRHYKGGEYEVIGLAVHEWAKEHEPTFDPNGENNCYVVYRPLSDGSLLGTDTLAQMWLRQLSDFNHLIMLDYNNYVPRFEKIEYDATSGIDQGGRPEGAIAETEPSDG